MNTTHHHHHHRQQSQRRPVPSLLLPLLLLLLALLALSCFDTVAATGATTTTTTTGSHSSTDVDTIMLVEHSFDSGASWTDRGTIRISRDTAKRLVYRPTREWTIEDVHRLSGNAMYMVRLVKQGTSSSSSSAPHGGDDDAVVVMVSVNACDLLESDLREVFHVETGGVNGNDIVALTVYGASTMPRRRSPFRDVCLRRWSESAGHMERLLQTLAHKQTEQKGHKHLGMPRVKLVVSTGVPGNKISAKSLQQLEQRQKEVQQQKDEPGFIRKYWYYILPVMIMILMSAFVPEVSHEGEGEGSGGGGGGRGQSARS